MIDRAKALTRAATLAGAVVAAAPVAAEETLPPIPIGPRTLARWQQNGQVLRIETGALSATMYWDELSTRRIAGFVVRTSGGTTQGPVTIRWENRQSAVTLHLDAAHPGSAFEMLGPQPRRPPHVRQHD